MKILPALLVSVMALSAAGLSGLRAQDDVTAVAAGRVVTLGIPGIAPVAWTLYSADEKEIQTGWRAAKVEVLQESPADGRPAEWMYRYPDGETLLLRRTVQKVPGGWRFRDEWKAPEGAVTGHLQLNMNLDTAQLSDGSYDAGDGDTPLIVSAESTVKSDPMKLVEGVVFTGVDGRKVTVRFDQPVAFEVLHHPSENGVARHEFRWFFGRPALEMRAEERALTEGAVEWTLLVEPR